MSDEALLYQRITDSLSSSLEIEQALAASFAIIERQFDADGIYLNVFVPGTKEIHPIAHADRNGAAVAGNDVILADDLVVSLKHGTRSSAMLIDQVSEDPITEFVLSELAIAANSVMLVNLDIDKTHLGVVGVYSRSSNHFSKEQLKLLSALAGPYSLVTAFALQRQDILRDNQILQMENRALKHAIEAQGAHTEVVGESNGLKLVMEQVGAIAQLNTTVLINGETGTGKEVIANAIHARSPRHDKPFIKVNCGAIPDALIDSELFGHEKGSFTGADKTTKGYFEQANGGTIFLDELGELPLSAQVRLLRVLQNKTIVRVGSVKSIELDIRVIAATHRDLTDMVEQGKFREDLWYRISIFPIHIPSLQQRQQDIPLLVYHFIDSLSRTLELPYKVQVSNDDLLRLQNHPWKGNVRELMNVVERALIQSNDGQLDFRFLGGVIAEPEIAGAEQELAKPSVVIDVSKAGNKLISLELMNKKYIEHALYLTKGKINGEGGAAELLDIHPNTLRSRMTKLNIG
ncbi:sigma-54 interaction domain-containing protein [Paraferrimonas haliotis]|uniref:ATPase AAA n=1 Tax=Paraferrimonas haliotis TaxID=2013866 RepID=A0AA37WXR5_9GAMM|nr:sigma-54 dependent transcriptional regulator [Paraferrimonas haliotis]GLS82880.1 ATPase AAA [Paraferrimonas haliotis]